MSNKIYTTGEVAAMLGISESMVQKYARTLNVDKFKKSYVFTERSITAVKRHMEARRVAQAETRLENISRAAAVPFNQPITPSRSSDEYKPREPYRSGDTPRTAGNVSAALAGIEEARDRAAAANRREAARVGLR